MKVECPSCQTTYNLPGEKVGPDGAHVRCSVCKHVFHVEPESTEDFPGFGDSGADAGWPVETPSQQGQDDGFAATLDDERQKDRFEDATVSSREFSSIDFGLEEKGSKGLSGRSIVLALLVGVIALGGTLGTAAYFFEFWPFAKKPASSAMENAPAQPAPPAAPKETVPDYADKLAFESFNNYPVENEKMGEAGKPAKLLVIEGKLVNRSPVTVGQVSIEATLIDAKDSPVASKIFLGGPKANFFELKNLGKEDLENRLNSNQERQLHNSRVKPGEEIPFQVVFVNPPENLKNFSLRIKDYFQVASEQPEQQSAPKK